MDISPGILARVAAHALAQPAPPPPPPFPRPSPIAPTPQRWLSMNTLHDFYDEILLLFHVLGTIAWFGLLLATIVLMGAATAWLRVDAARRQQVP